MRTLLGELPGLREVKAPATIQATLGLGDRYATVKTALGPVFVTFNDRGATSVRRGASPRAFERAWRREHRHPIRRVPAPRTFRFDLTGLTPFEQAVLRKAAEIPSGEVRTYTWVAREIGHPAAVRAVGSALGRNPMPLLIPCHRVVRTDGVIGDFIYGTPAKRTLLASEGVAETELRGYLGSDTTRIFCFPTCRAARRIMPKHQVPFGSPHAAKRSGYRPCKLCRPAAA
jgi:O-6-methylguanine DNA methyltransferase